VHISFSLRLLLQVHVCVCFLSNVQAQVLNDGAAQKKLGKIKHTVDSVPVMFFGTLEIAWIGQADIVCFKDGVLQGFLVKGKHKSFLRACGQVRFLFLGTLPRDSVQQHRTLSDLPTLVAAPWKMVPRRSAGIVGGFEGSKARQVLVPDFIALEQLLENEKN
jgi:hypothetical protein